MKLFCSLHWFPLHTHHRLASLKQSNVCSLFSHRRGLYTQYGRGLAQKDWLKEYTLALILSTRYQHPPPCHTIQASRQYFIHWVHWAGSLPSPAAPPSHSHSAAALLRGSSRWAPRAGPCFTLTLQLPTSLAHLSHQHWPAPCRVGTL